MLPWIHLATATAPDGDRLRLLRRGDEFSIRLGGGNELMNSRLGHSEEALARLALTRLSGRPAPQVLIGGLGMGFTLRAAQAAAPPDARLVVAEIVPELVGWAGQHMASVFGDCLADPRVRVETRDVGAMIREAAGQFENGLRAARRALAPGGVLAVWSAAPAPAFSQRLSRCGFDVTTQMVRAHGGKGGNRHTIWIAARTG